MDALERIKTEARLLPLEQRDDLRRFLTKSINAERETPPDVPPSEVIDIAEMITGGDVLGNRERRNVYARILVAQRLRQAGVRHADIGKALGIDRSSAYHLTHRADEVAATPGIDPELARDIKRMNEILPL